MWSEVYDPNLCDLLPHLPQAHLQRLIGAFRQSISLWIIYRISFVHNCIVLGEAFDHVIDKL